MAGIPLLAEIIAKEAAAIDYNRNHVDDIAAGIAEEAATMSEDEFYQIVLDYILNSSEYPMIMKAIKDFLNKLQQYQVPTKFGGGGLAARIQYLKQQKDIIYADFFTLQNLINSFLGQRIQMTYVHVDDEGRREIRISDNDIEHLVIQDIKSYWGQSAKLTYVVETGYNKLMNSLPQEENEQLQTTATTVERRYDLNKKRVMWFFPDRPENWKGYKFNSKGPINEAFVNMYVHEIKLSYSLEENIDVFMLDTSYGAIKADATKGFLLGDISKGTTQYAVKGLFGSPQGVVDVIEHFETLQREGFSPESFARFIKYFTYDELHKNYAPQIKEMTKRSINATLRHLAETGELLDFQ